MEMVKQRSETVYPSGAHDINNQLQVFIEVLPYAQHKQNHVSHTIILAFSPVWNKKGTYRFKELSRRESQTPSISTWQEDNALNIWAHS